MPRIAKVFLLALLVPARMQAGEDPARQSVDSNGVKISYVVQGKGEPVVLIHGLCSSVAVNWQIPGTFTMLAQDHQVIAMDMPGHGMSDKPEKEEAYGVAMVEDVIKVLDQLEIKKAHVVGYSMGGIIAAKLVTLHPERVLSAALCGMGWLREGGAPQRIFEALGKGNAAVGICTRSIGKLAISEKDLKAITVPVAMLVGDSDICKALYVEPAHRAREDWPVVEIKGANHLDCIVKPQFKDELKKWIAQQAKK